MINIVSSQMDIPHSALELYVSGCTRYCPGCQNQYLQKFNQGTPWIEWIKSNSKKFSNPLVNRIWILGGDLLCQEYDDIIYLINDIRRNTNRELWLWTGETLDNINNSSLLLEAVTLFDYVKVGPYDENNHDRLIYNIDNEELEIAGSNQSLYRISDRNFIGLPCRLIKSS